jgi:hypothetical protein
LIRQSLILVHGPGELTNDLVAMEVKPINARKPGIRKNLEGIDSGQARERELVG